MPPASKRGGAYAHVLATTRPRHIITLVGLSIAEGGLLRGSTIHDPGKSYVWVAAAFNPTRRHFSSLRAGLSQRTKEGRRKKPHKISFEAYVCAVSDAATTACNGRTSVAEGGVAGD